MDITQLHDWIKNLTTIFSKNQLKIGKEILKELMNRLNFLLNVGLDYISLNLPASTLSGGEAQRIRLASQIGSELTGVLYIIDEPSIGLHQRDNNRLIDSLKKLKGTGNSIIVVEHDKDMILESDYLIDIGPGAGVNGGKIVTQGISKNIRSLNSLTAQYLNGKKSIPLPTKRRKGSGKTINLNGLSGNNLKTLMYPFL